VPSPPPSHRLQPPVSTLVSWRAPKSAANSGQEWPNRAIQGDRGRLACPIWRPAEFPRLVVLASAGPHFPFCQPAPWPFAVRTNFCTISAPSSAFVRPKSPRCGSGCPQPSALTPGARQKLRPKMAKSGQKWPTHPRQFSDLIPQPSPGPWPLALGSTTSLVPFSHLSEPREAANATRGRPRTSQLETRDLMTKL
jgi:hypothetical protein